jgi:hypothetical protein
VQTRTDVAHQRKREWSPRRAEPCLANATPIITCTGQLEIDDDPGPGSRAQIGARSRLVIVSASSQGRCVCGVLRSFRDRLDLAAPSSFPIKRRPRYPSLETRNAVLFFEGIFFPYQRTVVLGRCDVSARTPVFGSRWEGKRPDQADICYVGSRL